ncbi:MarR family winged helix-turn-helix transcriptional regulator [Roseibium sp.]|uniref:MarR family winged helix-turn-helix transcriptional regulator n=1 Tax=Roseibium sp. TaxID=1936156 RepID=UPI003A96CF73
MTQTSLFDLDPIPAPEPAPKKKAEPKAKAAATSEKSEAAQTPDKASKPAQGKTPAAAAKTPKKAKKAGAKQPVAKPTEGSANLPETADLDLDQFLCFSLYSANHAMNRVYKPFLSELGLTYPQYLAMTVLWQKDKILVGELGDRLHLESNTMTPLLKRLETMELLTRTRDKKDERQVRIALTRQGRVLRKKTASLAACILSATGMPLEDVIDLQQKIMSLRENLLKSASETA